MSDRIVIDVDRDGWTKGLQLNIAQLDDNNAGHGYRLKGPKYNGSSKNLLRCTLDERDAAEIRKFLDAVFPVAQPPENEHCPAECGGPGYSHCELPSGHNGAHEAAMGNMRRETWGGQ